MLIMSFRILAPRYQIPSFVPWCPFQNHTEPRKNTAQRVVRKNKQDIPFNASPQHRYFHVQSIHVAQFQNPGEMLNEAVKILQLFFDLVFGIAGRLLCSIRASIHLVQHPLPSVLNRLAQLRNESPRR